MKSALAIVAFRHGTQRQGITALLETALTALDDSGNHSVAVHVSMALARMEAQEPNLLSGVLSQITDFG
jgi:hypothetical protein